MYQGPSCGYFSSLLEEANKSSVSHTVYSPCEERRIPLHSLRFQPLIGTLLDTPRRFTGAALAPWGENFVRRERIATAAIFVPNEPLHKHAALPEVLFLNVRQPGWRSSMAPMGSDDDIAALAARIMTQAVTSFAQRSKTKAWVGAQGRSMRFQSRLLEITHNVFR